jgi:SAM-dependent methyltransferase
MSRTSVDLLRALTLTDSGSSTPRDDLHATARALFFSAQSTGRVKARITSNASGLSTTHPSDQPAEDRMLQTYPAHCFQDARFKDSVAIFDSLFRQAFASSTLAFSPLQAEVAAKPVVGKQSPTTAVKLSTPKRVLEVGCGSGAWMVRQTREWPKALFTGLDLFHNDLTADWMPFEVAERVHIVRGNFLEQLPFDDDSFEMVFGEFRVYRRPPLISNSPLVCGRHSRVLLHRLR